MFKQFVKSVLCLLMVSLFFPGLCSAQSSRPAISPWMGMFDRSRNTGGLDNYTRIVKPRQDMLKAYANQAGQMQVQQQMLQTLQNGGVPGTNASGLADAAAGAAAGGMLSGSGKTMILSPPREIPSSKNPATFNQYLHYYPSASMQRKQVPNFSGSGRRY